MAKFAIAAVLAVSIPSVCGADIVHNIYIFHYSKNSDNPVSYNGSRPIKLRTAAVSHDLKHLLNKTAIIHYDNMKIKVIITDLMHKRHKRSIDVYVENKALAIKLGRQRGSIEILKGGN